MRTKITLIAAIVVLAMALSIMAVIAEQGSMTGAGPERGMKGAGMKAGMDAMIKELNLTPDQQTRFNALHEQFMATTAPLREQLRLRQQEMDALLASDTSTAAQIKEKADQIDALRTQIRDAGIDMMVQARSILTPEQRVKARAMMNKHHGFGMGMGLGKGHGGRHHGGVRGAGPGCGCIR